MTTMKTACFVLFTLTQLLQCAQPEARQKNYIFRDRDGLYEFDPQTQKETVVHKLKDFQIFLNEPYTLLNDSLTFGVVGQRAVSTEYNGTHYFNYYVTIDLKNGKSRVSREVHYDTDIADKQLTISVRDIDREYRQKTVADTTIIYSGNQITQRGLVFGNAPHFYDGKWHPLAKSVTAFSNDGRYKILQRDNKICIVEKESKAEKLMGAGSFAQWKNN